jgi:hypothetical protein
MAKYQNTTSRMRCSDLDPESDIAMTARLLLLPVRRQGQGGGLATKVLHLAGRCGAGGVAGQPALEGLRGEENISELCRRGL